jgi:hypothetical protein
MILTIVLFIRFVKVFPFLAMNYVVNFHERKISWNHQLLFLLNIILELEIVVSER